jgi:hypothetical protein
VTKSTVRIHTRLLAATVVWLFFSTLLRAQAGSADVPQSQTANTGQESQQKSMTIYQPTPMTQGERFRDYLRGAFSFKAFVSAGASAGYGQLRDRPREWHEGGQGFSKRYVSAFSGHMVHDTLQYVVSAGLHEDNRYVRSGKTGFGPRLGYALASTFLARHDDGTRGLSVSALTGAAGAAAISRVWQPPSTAKARNGAIAFSVSLGVTAGFNVAREFLFSGK